MNESPTLDELLVLAREILEQKDSYAVVELLSRQPPQLAAEAYEKLQVELYWKRGDLPTMVALSRAGIQHGLTATSTAAEAAEAQALRLSAKHLAYNLASFTWPGWNEKGITLTRSDLAVGLEAAQLNLRLAEELDRPEKARANALWALGAHLLAASQHQPAADAFLRGKSHAAGAKDPLLERMLDGYALLAHILDKPDDTEARSKFDAAVAALKQEGSEDAQEYAGQLPVAMEVF